MILLQISHYPLNDTELATFTNLLTTGDDILLLGEGLRFLTDANANWLWKKHSCYVLKVEVTARKLNESIPVAVQEISHIQWVELVAKHAKILNL